MPLTRREILVSRSAAQLLDQRIEADPESGVRRLLAVQAQDRTMWRFALRARVAGITALDVDAALTERRSLLVAWLNRGTLHAVCSEDYAWLSALTAPTQRNANARRLWQTGLSVDGTERGIALIERLLADEGPIRRDDLRRRLTEAGIHTAGQAYVHLLFAAVTRGVAVLGPMIAGQQAFAPTREWLGKLAEPPRGDWRDSALAELARRYLAGHGPATDADLARWSGLPLRDARSGLRAIGGELDEMGDGLCDLKRQRPDPFVRLPARLLPAWDPSLVGWRDREPFLTGTDEANVIPPGGGFFRPFGSVDGVAVATWSVSRSKDRMRIEVKPFVALDDEAATELEAEALDLARFEGRRREEIRV